MKCSLSGLWKALDRLRPTFKKTLRAAEQARPDVAERRALWRARQVGLDPERLVFIDETWATTNMTRLRGRAWRGARVVDFVRHGHWKTTTLIAVLDRHGIRCSMELDGAVNQLAFTAYVAQVLTPTLRPGDLVILDNLSSHKGARVRDLVRAAQAERVYLPPYSPNLNPIALAFSKIKPALRGLATRPLDQLWSGMQGVLDNVTAAEAAGLLQYCGYPLQIK